MARWSGEREKAPHGDKPLQSRPVPSGRGLDPLIVGSAAVKRFPRSRLLSPDVGTTHGLAEELVSSGRWRPVVGVPSNRGESPSEFSTGSTEIESHCAATRYGIRG